MSQPRPGPENVSRETFWRLGVFRDLLVRWNARINLISPADMDQLETRHIVDSAQLYDLAPADARTWIDLGTGAGFPGLICAIRAAESASTCAFTFIESDTRKAAFLREAIRVTEINAEVIKGRIEQTDLPPADVISARALAPLPRLLGYSAPFCHARTCLLFPKGANVESELTEAQTHWHIAVERVPSSSDASGTILKLTEVAPRS